MADEEPSDVERAIAYVEQTIEGLGIDPAASRNQRQGHTTWALRRGSARILIGVHGASDAVPDGRLRVVSPVVRMVDGDKQLGLCRWLLEANAAELVGAAFAISGDDVVVVAERSVGDLDAPMVDALIRTVGRVADRFDDELATRFGAVRSSDA